MGNFLHKLGSASFRHPWRVTLSWLLILVILGVAASQFMKPTSSSISIPGTEAQKAIDRASELFPDGGKGSGRLVFHATNDKQLSDYKPDIEALIEKIEKVDGVSQVVSPFADPSLISKSQIGYAQVQFDASTGSIDESDLAKITDEVNATRKDDLQIEQGGDLVSRAPGEIIGVGELGGVLLALVVLVMTFGSLVAAGMPIISALTAIGVSMTGLFAMSHLFEINSTTPVLAVMLGLAVGIDYSLFIINKYRSYLLQGYKRPDAAARAIGTAGNAVVFAALTVVIALAALSVVNIPFITTMGLVGAGSIAISALVAITLTPALLHLVGGRVFGRKLRTAAELAQKRGVAATPALDRKSFWYRWGEMLAKYPIPVLVIAIAIIGVIALPAKDLATGLPTDQYSEPSSTQRKAYDLLTDGFGAGFNGPLTVVVEGLPQVSEQDKDAIRKPAMDEYNKQVAAATENQQALFQQQAAQAVTIQQQMALQQTVAAAKAAGEKQQQAALAEIEKNVDKYAKLVQLKKVADEVAKMDTVEKALPALATDDGKAGIIQVIAKTAPADQQTKDLIADLRDDTKQREVTGSDSVSLAVTGTTALQDDINAKLTAAMPVYLAVVVGLSLILLIVAFRSILVPIKATLGFLLSVLAMFGAMVAVFQWGWFGITDAPGPIVSFLPIIAIGILFGLAMDYEFFLVSGMHESYSHTKNARESVVRGFGMGSKVVTAAGVIMISVFAGFITNHDTTIQSIGFGLAVGILVDAFLVRITIVPAVMSLLGKSAWWLPKWLDKRLPHVSIEGEEQK